MKKQNETGIRFVAFASDVSEELLERLKRSRESILCDIAARRLINIAHHGRNDTSLLKAQVGVRQGVPTATKQAGEAE